MTGLASCSAAQNHLFPAQTHHHMHNVGIPKTRQKPGPVLALLPLHNAEIIALLAYISCQITLSFSLCEQQNTLKTVPATSKTNAFAQSSLCKHLQVKQNA